MQTTCQRGLINYDNSKTEEIEPNNQGFYASNHARVLFFANHNAEGRRRFSLTVPMANQLFKALLALSNASGQP